MFTHYQCSGFILKKKNIREADQIFTIYTKEFGKLKFLAKGSRKIKSKLRGGLKLFTFNEIELIQGKGYKTLINSEKKDKFAKISNSLIKLKTAYKIIEVLDRLIKEEDQDKRIWELLVKTLERLDSCQSKVYICRLIYYYYFWKLIALMGVNPSIHNCVLCQKKSLLPPFYFSSHQGGIVCEKCFNQIEDGINIDIETIRILKIIFRKDWTFLLGVKLKQEHLKSLKRITDSYYFYLLQELSMNE